MSTRPAEYGVWPAETPKRRVGVVLLQSRVTGVGQLVSGTVKSKNRGGSGWPDPEK